MVWVGIGIACLGGLVFLVGQVFPNFRLGRLPGDIVIENGGSKVFIPITTMILASAVLSLIFWLVGVVRR